MTVSVEVCTVEVNIGTVAGLNEHTGGTVTAGVITLQESVTPGLVPVLM